MSCSIQSKTQYSIFSYFEVGNVLMVVGLFGMYIFYFLTNILVPISMAIEN
jgi:hypothetical protein